MVTLHTHAPGQALSGRSSRLQHVERPLGPRAVVGPFRSASLSPIDYPKQRGAAAILAATPRPGASSVPGPAAPQPATHGLVAVLPYTEEEYVEVGRVTGAHGIRGDVRVEASTDEPARRFKAGSKLYLLAPTPQGLAARGSTPALALAPVTSRGAKSRPLGKGQEAWLLGLQEITDRTKAEQLYGYVLYCAASDRESLRDPDEFYVSDIIGCTVIDKASRRMVGSVVDVYSGMGTHDTLRVKLRASEQDILNSRIRYCLVPFAKAICPVLDLQARTLEVVPPEGLLDLASAEPLKRPLSDEAKAAKLQQLREQLAREEAERQSRRQHQGEQEEARASEPQASSSGGDDDEEKEEGEREEEAKSAESRPVRQKRPGLRRRPAGGLRLGRREA